MDPRIIYNSDYFGTAWKLGLHDNDCETVRLTQELHGNDCVGAT